MPRRPGGRYVLPIAKKKGKTDFRTINPLLQHFQQANIIWASCQAGKIDTGTLPPLPRPTPTSQGLPGLTDETKEIFRLNRLAERERRRAFDEAQRQTRNLQSLGIAVAVGIPIAAISWAFGPALGAGVYASSASYTVAAETIVATTGAALPEIALLPGASVIAGTVAVAAGADFNSPAMTGLPSVHAKATPVKGKGYAPMVFTKFSKPCGNK